MGIRVLTPAQEWRLTSVAKAKERLGILESDTSRDAILGDLIKSVSSRFSLALSRPLARQRYLLTAAGYGTRTLTLPLRPIEALNTLNVTYSGQVLTGVTVQDAELGFLGAEVPFAWTAEVAGLLDLNPTPGTEKELFSVECWGGYLVLTQGLRSGDDGVTHLAAKTPALAGSSTLVLEATGVTGTASRTWGLAIEGHAANYGLSADVAVASSELTLALTSPLTATVAVGTLIQLSPYYLPPAVEDLALRAVVDGFRRRGLVTGVTALRTPGFSAEFERTGDSGLPVSIEHELRGLGV